MTARRAAARGRHPRGRHPNSRFLRSLTGAAAALLAATMGGCDSFFYRPEVAQRTVEVPGFEVSGLEIPAPGPDAIHGVWIPARGECYGTVVYCYGYDRNLAKHIGEVLWLPDAGFNVLGFDYRGYGRSPGRPTREGTIEDAAAAIDAALVRDPQRTVVFGHSLGGAVAVAAAARRPAVRAVVAEATFPTYRAAAGARVPVLAWLVPALVSSGFDPVEAVAALPPRPLLVIHGSADRRVPVRLGRELFARAAEPKELIVFPGGTHGSPWGEHREEYRRRFAQFLRAAIER